MRGVSHVNRLARRIWLSTQARAMILLYHRVTRISADPQLLAVTPEHFAEHLEHLRTSYSPISLVSLKRALEGGRIPHRAVVVTFDDGYSYNAEYAKPILERFDVPATVFVTGSCVGQMREFWWDELERLVLQPGTLPAKLRLSLDGHAYQWELGHAAHYREDAYRSHRRWTILEKDDPSPRHSLYRSLHQLLRPLLEGERRAVLGELAVWAGVEPVIRFTHRVLSPVELRALGEGGLVEVGAHTMTHPVLATLPVASQVAEIKGSKEFLEEILGCPVTSFAYPYGGRADYMQETVSLVREAGFECACSNIADIVWRGTDRFQLPRMLVRDWDGEMLARRLREWFRG